MSNPEDLFVREMMLKMWTSFVINGHPTPDGSLGFTWEEVSSPAINYLSITTAPSMKAVDTKVREFWRSMPTKTHQMLPCTNVAQDGASCVKLKLNTGLTRRHL